MSERIMINCGLILRGGASDIDKLLVQAESDDITIVRKEVSVDGGKLWITKGNRPENNEEVRGQ